MAPRRMSGYSDRRATRIPEKGALGRALAVGVAVYAGSNSIAGLAGLDVSPHSKAFHAVQAVTAVGTALAVDAHSRAGQRATTDRTGRHADRAPRRRHERGPTERNQRHTGFGPR